MVRPPRVFPRVAIVIVLSVPILAFGQAAPAPAPAPPRTPAPTLVRPAPATAAAPAPETPAAAPATSAPSDLATSVDDFWHYAKVARYDLAAAAAQKILANRDNPVAVLEAFEAVSEKHNDKDKIDQWMLKWQGVD